MRVLVTGAGGFVGRTVARRAAEEGEEVAGLARRAGDRVTLVLPAPWTATALEDVLRRVRPDAVVHCAGGPTVELAALYRDNTVLTEALLTAMERTVPDARCVVVGSAAEYGEPAHADGRCMEDDTSVPLTPYGIAKLAATHHALMHRARGTRITVARLFNPVGVGLPDGLAASSFAARLAALGPFERDACLRTGNLDARRDLFAVDEAGRILLALARAADTPGIVNVCSGVATPIRAVAEHLVGRAGARRGGEVALCASGEAQGPAAIWGDTARLKSLGVAPADPALGPALDALLDGRMDAMTGRMNARMNARMNERVGALPDERSDERPNGPPRVVGAA